MKVRMGHGPGSRHVFTQALTLKRNGKGEKAKWRTLLFARPESESISQIGKCFGVLVSKT